MLESQDTGASAERSDFSHCQWLDFLKGRARSFNSNVRLSCVTLQKKCQISIQLRLPKRNEENARCSTLKNEGITITTTTSKLAMKKDRWGMRNGIWYWTRGRWPYRSALHATSVSYFWQFGRTISYVKPNSITSIINSFRKVPTLILGTCKCLLRLPKRPGGR